MKMTASFHHKESYIECSPCTVEKVIEMSGEEFVSFQNNLLSEHEFIKENNDLMYNDEDGDHCILVIGKGYDDGILVDSEGFSYARYAAYIPNARQILQMDQRCDCIKDLERTLDSAVSAIVSDVKDYHGEGCYRVLIDDIVEYFNIEERYIPLLVTMIGEHNYIENAEVIDYEIMINPNRESNEFHMASAKRSAEILAKALDYIAESENGEELYKILSEKLEMSDDEINNIGFDLDEYAEESTDISMSSL